MIYIDLLIILNYFYDFFLLFTVGIALKRIIKIKKLLAASLVGALSILIILFNPSNIILIIYKGIISIMMSLIAYGYKNIKYFLENISYLYMTSIVLAGFMYYVSLEFTSEYIMLIIISPLILGLYIYQAKKLKQKQNLNYEVKIVFKDDKNITLNGFIDSGNKLKDPFTNKYIIIVDKTIYHNKNPIYVPFKGVNKSGLLECFSLKYIEINNQKFNNYLLGVSNEKINLDGSKCILNCRLMEDLNV